MTTRAVRRFTTEPVSEEDLWTCLRAAQQAPSGGNLQPTRYLVVTDPSVKAQVGKLYRRSFGAYSALLPPPSDAADRRLRRSARHLAMHLGDAPALVFFLMPASWGTELDVGPLHASVYPAVQNFCLAARALGLGTTLTTVIRVHMAETLTLLAVSDKLEIAALVPVGHPAGSFGVASRHDVRAMTRWR